MHSIRYGSALYNYYNIGAVLFNMVQHYISIYGAVLINLVRYYSIWCGTLQYGAALFKTKHVLRVRFVQNVTYL